MPVFCVDMTSKQIDYVEAGLRQSMDEFFERLSDVTEIHPHWLESKLGETFKIKKVHSGTPIHFSRIRREKNQNLLCMIYPISQDRSGRFVEVDPCRG